ncbi:MAG: T9SS type A sorting domain-containing protein [Bacteroidetes bacterium]|nr:T9SS type A sorting domain-containing protein [Bacteroidota bacterium]
MPTLLHLLLPLQLLLELSPALAQPLIQWQKSLGGSNNDMAYSIQQTNDGGYIIGGVSNSSNGDVTGNRGNNDYWVVKLDSSGNISWQKSFGGSNNDMAYSIQQTNDGGYVVAGRSDSDNGDVTGNHGLSDYWVVKLDNSGNISWQKSFGGTNFDEAYSIQNTSEGGYVVAGSSKSPNGDVTGNHGMEDYWIVKLSPATSVAEISGLTPSVTIYPNPGNGTFTLVFPYSLSPIPYSLKIYNVFGEEIYSSSFSNISERLTLNISQPSGIYYYNINGEDGNLQCGKLFFTN